MPHKGRPLVDVFRERVEALVAEHHDGNAAAAADKIGIAQPTMSKLLSGKSKAPSVELVVQIARAYDLSVEALIGEPTRASGTEAAVRRAADQIRAAVAQLESATGVAGGSRRRIGPKRPPKPFNPPGAGGESDEESA